MKLAVTATGPALEAEVDPRFGRAQYFLIVDSKTMAIEVMENSSINAAHGAGIQSGQIMSEKGVEVVVTGSVGPNAFHTLSAAGIQILQSPVGSVQHAVELFNEGKLQAITQFGPAHAGTGGMGSGRGMGMGRGMGRGMGSGRGFQSQNQQQPPLSKEEEIRDLKERAADAGKQLEEIQKRISELEKND